MPGLVTATRPAGAVTSAVVISTPAVAETSDSHAWKLWMRMHTPAAVRMVIMGGASVRGTAAVSELFFFEGGCSSVHGRWFQAWRVS